VRVTMAVDSNSASRTASLLLPPQAGARVGTRRADTAASRRTTSMDSIDDLGTSIGRLEQSHGSSGPPRIRCGTGVYTGRRSERDVVVRGGRRAGIRIVGRT